MNNKNLIISLLFTLLVITACQNNEPPKKIVKLKKLPFVSIQKAKIHKMVSSITIPGTIDANIFSNIVSPVDGVIDVLNARENQQVKKGKMIAVINPNRRVSLIAENQLRVEQLQQQLKTSKQNSDSYATTKMELDKALSNLKYAKNMYQTNPVICPADGMVTQRWLDAGAQVNTRDKILTITDMSSLVIKTEVNEQYFEAIKKGKKLPLQLNAYPNDSLKGVINLVYPEIKPETRSVSFDIKILNFQKKLLPGMMATITIPVKTIDQAVVVPADAVLSGPDNKEFLFVVDKNLKTHKQLVETGITMDGLVQITKGLTGNENVAVKGQEMLKDGIEVKIAQSKQVSKQVSKQTSTPASKE
ncbi:efflux RND transporter periplasmic adaptor subunit [Puteibacter caeruleilacunae]|nr:efflux RND transporter periplasmic adaptor subunit [Puteibacter caeruleilacunae]